MSDVNYIITIDDRDALKALSDMKVGFNSVGTAATQAQQKTDTSTKKIGRDVNNVDKEFKKASSSGLSFWKLVGGSAVGNLASQALSSLASGLVSVGKSAIKSSAQFEQFRVVLTNTLGSGAAADIALNRITEFAAKTPFQIDELTSSFIKFANRGLKLTTEEMTNIGDLAASQGKSFDQLTEAILDAQTGEFERLKEFGVRATQANGKVTLAFKDQTVVVDKNNKAITEAILKFGELQGVAGGMEAISKTLNGQISNLQDKFAILGRDLGDEFAPAIKEIVTGMNDFLSTLDAGTILAYFAPLKDTLLPALEKLFDALVDVISTLSGVDFSKPEEATSSLNKAFLILVDALTFVVDVARELITVFDAILNFYPIKVLIDNLGNSINFLGKAFAYVNGLFGENAEAAQNNALAQAEAKKVMDALHKTTFEGNQLAIDNLKKTKDNTKATTDNAAADKKAEEAKKKLAQAIDTLNKSYEDLENRASQAFANSLSGIGREEALANIALLELQKFEQQLTAQAQKAGKKINQDAINNIETLRREIIRERDAAILDINKETGDAIATETIAFYVALAAKVNEGVEKAQKNAGTELTKSIITFYSGLAQQIVDKQGSKSKGNLLERFLQDQFSISQEQAAAIISGITSTVSYIYDAFSDSVAAQTQAEIDRNQKLIDSLNERVEATKAALDEEYANQAKGSANILQLKQTEYDKLKIEQEQAAAQAEILRKRQLKQQLNAETISQASSLLTSSANIIQSFSALPLGIGVALSAVVIGAMFAAFAANRAKAYELANQSAYTGGPMTQFLNGKSDRDGQRAYVVVDDKGNSVLNLGGNETIMNPSASSTYKGELAAMNKGVYKHRGVGEVAENRALSIGQKQTEIVQMREQMNYEEMKRVFGEVMIGYHEDYKKYNDKKEVFIPTKDGYISKKGLHTKKVRI